MLNLKSVRRLDCIKLDAKDKTYFTEEGYLIDHPILTSCGIFEYINPDGSIRRELRLPEHVFAEKSLASYKGKPVIITHDAGVVNKNNVDDEQIGTILTEGYQDGDNVRAEIIIHNSDAMQDCGLRELSLGYNLDLIEEPGEWNGQHYDAIQTNIVINHLALVVNARAGEQARLNIDGSEEPTLKGGKAAMKGTAKKATAAKTAGKKTAKRFDSSTLTPEQMEEAIAMYCQEKGLDSEGEAAEGEVALDAEETVAQVQENKDRRDEEGEPADLEGAMEVIAQQDADIESLLQVIEQLKAEQGVAADEGEGEENSDEDENADGEENADEGEENADEDENADGDNSEDKSLNADSADKLISQRLAICRVGDKLNMDGLEKMPVMAAKKAIIKKVMPGMRLDGKGSAYIDAAYDIAVEKVNARKTTAYQKQQMASGVRADAGNGKSSASEARSRMLARREGGNE